MKRSRILTAIAASLIGLFTCHSALAADITKDYSYREWKSQDGSFKMVVKLVELKPGLLVLEEMGTGTRVDGMVERLSEADKRWVIGQLVQAQEQGL